MLMIFSLPNNKFHIKVYIQGGRKAVKKVITLFDAKNKVKLLFLAHQLRRNIHPFSQITLTKPQHLLF